MKIVIALFDPADGSGALGRLTDNGFSREDLSLISSAADLSFDLEDDIEGEPEETAITGAVIGGTAGGAVGALGAWAASSIPGLEAFSVAGLVATGAGAAIGTYLGGLYATRAETQTKLDIHQELDKGKVLLVIRTDQEGAEKAASLLEQSGGHDVEIHDLNSQ